MTTNRPRINQYNWFGQKLLAQHRYHELLCVRRYLATEIDRPRQSLIDLEQAQEQEQLLMGNQKLISDHIHYLTGLALMKTGCATHNELINTLQSLNYQKDGRYFLLLCRSLIYLGNHESLVAIFRQVLNKEIDTISVSSDRKADDEVAQVFYDEEKENPGDKESRSFDGKSSGKSIKSFREETLEFKNIFDCVNRNRLINDPRLWSIFAFSLELQGQLNDADFAMRIASKLASCQGKQMPAINKILQGIDGETWENVKDSSENLVSISDHNEPHARYAEFRIRHLDDYRTAVQVLRQANGINSAPVNYHLNPALALSLCSQPNSNASLFAKANQIIQATDNHSASTRNPSSVYNQVALRCKQKLGEIDPSQFSLASEIHASSYTSDEKRFSLSYALIKSFIIINDIVQNSSHEAMLFKYPKTPNLVGKTDDDSSSKIHAQIDRAIEALRSSDSSCWLSHSLWNNLGVCYLMKRRYVASLSCFTKALQLNPLDWRINQNLALVFLHVSVTFRALTSALASKSFYGWAMKIEGDSSARFYSRNSLISALLASCYSGLGLKSEARRYYSEMIAVARKAEGSRVPVLAIINYLLLLHNTEEVGKDELSFVDDQDIKLIARLLDQLEQDWLQRDPNDVQFISSHLDIARMIGISLSDSRPKNKKSYAWTKYQ